MGLFKNYVSQTRKPEGILGKMMLRGMNSGHAKMADWGLNHLQNIAPENIVDLGCGGGRNAGELLQRYPKAHVTAVDYSQLSVEKAREYNQEMIAAGRCTVQQGDVSALELPEEGYDLATAFETIPKNCCHNTALCHCFQQLRFCCFLYRQKKFIKEDMIQWSYGREEARLKTPALCERRLLK